MPIDYVTISDCRKTLYINTCLLGQVKARVSMARLNCQTDRISTRPHAKRCKYRSAVHFDGALAEAELISNLFVELARC